MDNALNDNNSWGNETLECLNRMHSIYRSYGDFIRNGTSCGKLKASKVYYDIADNIERIIVGGPDALNRMYTLSTRYM